MMPNIFAMCAAESLLWWETCSDAKGFSDDVHIKNTILFLVLILTIPFLGIILLVYWRNRK